MQEVGQWITVHGRKVFIADGESLEHALERQGIPTSYAEPKAKKSDIKFIQHDDMFLFVDKDFDIVGQIDGSIDESYDPEEGRNVKEFVVDFNSVEEGKEGKGIGSAMLSHIEDVAREKGAERISLLAAPTDERSSIQDLVKFYKKNGFEISGGLSEDEIIQDGVKGLKNLPKKSMIAMVKKLR